jgi:hypothetical protein
MGGGLMQLVAYGAQDIYLTGNPQITFFKVVYRRHTNFSMEAIEQTWNGNSGAASVVDAQTRCTATISRNGDLVHRMYLELTSTSSTTHNLPNPSSQSIINVTCEIGGQQIDKQSGDWMEVWSELTQPNQTFHSGLVGNVMAGTNFQNMSGMGGCVTNDTAVACQFHVPLQFWFCRNPGLALPLIALQYHEVKIILEANWNNGFAGASNFTNKLYVDYIYLDTDERRRFAQVSHEYLIEQIQEQTLGTVAGSSELNFNHPVKELIWCTFGTKAAATGYPLSLCSGSGNTYVATDTYQLKLNGHDRFSVRHVSYFTRTQVWQHHTGPGGIKPLAEATSSTALTLINGSQDNGSIAVYSFALKPEEHQPSGTCNFSRIDTAQLVAGSTCLANTIFAVNYNVLRIMSGMGGLAYSN